MGDCFDHFPRVADFPERRGEARQETLSALGALLDSVRREGEFEALAVADETGILVAGAGAFDTCEEIAAIAPLTLTDREFRRATCTPVRAANDTIPTRIEVLARRMEVRRLRIDGVEVLLCGDGGDRETLTRAAEGCARILGSRAPRR